MTKLELAKSVVNSIEDMTFNCHVWASSGGKCCDGWDDCLDLELSKEGILYLLSSEFSAEGLFDDISMAEVDVDSIITDLAYEGAWPDGGPSARVKHPIPEELKDLSQRISELDINDPISTKNIISELKSIKEDKYTFVFDVVDGGHTYYFAEDYPAKINLDTKEAIGLLWGYHKIDNLFKGLCDEPLGESDINEWAGYDNIASNCDYFGYGGSCERLEQYIASMCTVLEKIFDGSITEENLDDWMEYFEDSWNFDYDIEEWHNDKN